MAIERISVKTLRQEVYDQLRDKIISAEILPGQTISLRELANDYEIVLPRGAGYETLAGFVLSLLGVIPKGGESVVYDGRRFTVAEMDGRRVAKVRIETLSVTSPQVKPSLGRSQVQTS